MNKLLSLIIKLGARLALGLAASAILSSAFAQTEPDKLGEIQKQLQSLVQTVEDLRRARTNGLPAEADSGTNAARSVLKPDKNESIERIRDEGLNHSQVMRTLSYLSDVIGPRLTGSPNLKRANEWTRDTLSSWGLTNAHLEPWGPFGRGWELKRFSAQIVEPQTIILVAYPKAWSPGFENPVTAEVIYLDATNQAGLEKYKGRLKGAIVLSSPKRDVQPHYEPQAARLEATNLLRLANAVTSASAGTGAPRAQGLNQLRGGRRGGQGASTNSPSGRNGARFGGTFAFQARTLSFVAKEGAALLVSPSAQGDGGTIFVAQASVPAADAGNTNATIGPVRSSPWSTNALVTPPQITLAIEDYNRLVRMIQLGEELKMTVDLQVKFHDEDHMAYNTVAEITGSDLKDQIVMLGGHLDSWHSGTGATDNGAGVAATMEAVRILQAVNLRPRRTIRIGLWTGEEQGMLGSKAYVSQHFGYYTNVTNSVASDSGGDSSVPTAPRSTRELMRQSEYDALSAYFNLDNGAGKIRGVYMQGNEAVRPLFRRWLTPFADSGADTLTPANTGSTDHVSYDGIGLPGFEFIQDPLEYGSRTHHSNADVFDRVPEDDMKQAATIIAAFVYNTAMLDEKLPRKPLPAE